VLAQTTGCLDKSELIVFSGPLDTVEVFLKWSFPVSQFPRYGQPA